MLGCLPSAVTRDPIEVTVVGDRDLVHVTMVYQCTVAEMRKVMKIIMEKLYIYHKDMVKLSIFNISSSGLA